MRLSCTATTALKCFDLLSKGFLDSHCCTSLLCQVFRTYNASSMFERELRALEKEQTDKEVECGGPQLREMYLEANRRVCDTCY